MCRTQNASIRVLPLSKSQHIDAFCAQVVHGIAEYMYKHYPDAGILPVFVASLQKIPFNSDF